MSMTFEERQNAPLFNENDLIDVTDGNARLIRLIFTKFGISNNEYVMRYRKHLSETRPNDSQVQQSLKLCADRKFILDKRRLTPNIFKNVVRAMGYELSVIDYAPYEGEYPRDITSVTISSEGKQFTFTSSDPF